MCSSKYYHKMSSGARNGYLGLVKCVFFQYNKKGIQSVFANDREEKKKGGIAFG